MTRLPMRPLRPHLIRLRDAGGLSRFARQSGIASVQRVLRQESVTVSMADRICTALGKHPTEVFGNLWTSL